MMLSDAAFRRAIGMKQNVSGAWLCACGAELATDDDLTCAECRSRADESNKQRARDDWTASIRSFAPLGGVPAWPWARCENHEFTAGFRFGEVLAYARGYHPRQGSVLLAGKTGARKSSGTVAMLHRLRDAEIAKVLAGPPGSGPTATLRVLRGVLWTTGFEIAQARRQHSFGRGEADLVDRAMSCRLLVLDELGFEAVTDTVIAEIINARYAAGQLPVIVTTGLTVAQFRERYGDAVFRRIVERGNLIEAWT